MHLIIAAILCSAVYLIFQVVYRLAFHPLRKFAGPKLAASTDFYRAYYDVIGNGGWMYHMRELHDQYGPIVRVAPNELHFSDPDAFEEINIVQKCRKDQQFYELTADAVVAVSDPKEAAKRRTRLGPYFSRRAVLKLEHLVQKNVGKLVERLAFHSQLRAPADIYFAFRSTTIDIITSYLFSQEFKALDYPKFQHPALYGMDEALRGAYTLKYIPYSQWAITKLPEKVLRALIPATGPQLDQTKFIADKIDEFTSNPPSTENSAIFDVWLRRESEDGKNRESPWTAPRAQVIDECMSLQFAGSDTVGNACMIGTYHLLTRPDVLRKLRIELDEAWPDVDSKMKYESLERLPYLTAVIKESLRLSHGVATPLPRVTGPAGAVISGRFVPPNTAVASGTYIVHTNPSIFKAPTDFIPERWIGEDAKGLEKYLLSFSKGPRLCLGVNLAWCELYLIFASVFRKLDLEIHDTTEDDLRFSDFFIPVYTRKHLSAFVKEIRS
ncbi:hypothetical protein V5O48_004487 [Marasmius crinis-equi]|uniref:Cytochrome P450 n=1 Tax=Marasmius crinis-equi TaxID=585013 RepID=A0ABR3FQX3_9AGAR